VESVVIQFTIQKYEDYDVENYNFACCIYGSETWSLTLREECRLRVFENRVWRRIFGPKRDKVTVEGRKLRVLVDNEELNEIYMPHQIS